MVAIVTVAGGYDGRPRRWRSSSVPNSPMLVQRRHTAMQHIIARFILLLVFTSAFLGVGCGSLFTTTHGPCSFAIVVLLTIPFVSMLSRFSSWLDADERSEFVVSLGALEL